MKLTLASLNTHLQTQLLPVYWVSSDEPTLINTACEAIRAQAVKKGHTERHIFHIESGFDWRQLESIKNNFSLFDDKQCIEMRILISRIPQAGADFFAAIAQTPNPHQCWIIISDKLEAGILKSAWYEALEKSSGILALFPPQRHEWPHYIKQQLKAYGLMVNEEAQRYLTTFLEGNLVATQHILAQLQTLQSTTPLTLKEITGLVHDAAQYTVFDLVDAINNKNSARIPRLLQHLQEQGIEPPLVLWALNRECQARAQRTRSEQDYQRLLTAAETDLIIKGAKPGKPWLSLERLAVSLISTV